METVQVQLVQKLTTKTTLAMTQRMQISLRILHMNNADLGTYLLERARENPYLSVTLPRGSAMATDQGVDQLDFVASDGPSLEAHVTSYIDQTFSDPRQRDLAIGFLEALDSSGWLTSEPVAVAMAAGVSVHLGETVLRQLQDIEPAGLFARSLAECIRLQAKDAGFHSPELDVVIENLPLLAEDETGTLAQLAGCSVEHVLELAKLIRQFNPKPGLMFEDTRAPSVPPDVIARQDGTIWTVELNKSTLPTIAVREDLDGPANGPQTSERLNKARADAQWLEGTLERRRVTLLRTATLLIERQRAFLEQGPGALQPLSLADLGDALDLHPSTISRAISHRMVDTPLGTLPMKAFLSRTFASGQDEGETSQDAVLDLVRRIIASEDAAKPLSDTAIAAQAKEAGVHIARRTVAKFRGMLGIASSYQRRQTANVD
ncbi:MAG: RNA polymerase factor sigma-54 [Pseudomonadota bacterium]